CHSCHVMAHESFEDVEVAKLMNDNFINIKVDREERPDIDSIYMQVCQMFTGGGGWPLTVIMTPGKKPFFAGTYFPKFSVHNRIGIIELIDRIKDYWHNKRNQVDESAEEILSLLNNRNRINNFEPINYSIFERAFKELSFSFDSVFGGFGNKPKFPMPSYLFFLLRYWNMNNDEQSLNIVEKTLQEMRKGGIYDHIGFGFHRYSTDEQWLVPHFEKMLYDQALLSLLYTETYQATKNSEYKKVADEILDYVQKKLPPDGTFFSAEDADSEGEEGKFYLWESNEIEELLGDDSIVFNSIYNIKETGNFISEANQSQKYFNIPYLKTSIALLEGYNGINKIELIKKLEQIRIKLYEAREKRIHPGLDDKILTDWNGLMLASFARAGAVFGNPAYLIIAKRCADFFLNNMKTPDGKLFHRHRLGNSGIMGLLDDYSFFIWGLIELYSSTFEIEYLQSAIELMNICIEDFWSTDNNCFFQSSKNSEYLIARKIEFFDGAIPSGNSVMLQNLVVLSRITGEKNYYEIAEKLTLAFSESLNKAPTAYTQFLCSYYSFTGESREIVIIGDLNNVKTMQLLNIVNDFYIPGTVILHKQSNDSKIDEISELARNKTMINDEPTAYLCINNTCKEPVNETAKLRILLSGKI
ncbi:MAG: thioredoxin domain-containing protein, partial [Ignavibacteriae bacterium]|nr:thioredoxin domain-containing protein [Ignavibacteriota bacterium]